MGTWKNNIVTRAVKNWQLEKAKLPQEIGNIGQNYFVGSFRTKSWGMNVWPDRKDKNNTRSLLVETGKLRRNVSRSVRIANMKMIKWGVYLPYAEVHNDGYKGSATVGAYSRKRTGSVTGGAVGYLSKKAKRGRSGVGFTKGHDKQMNIPRRRFMGINSQLLNKINKRFKLRMRQTFR